MKTPFPGAKGGQGTWQKIINLMPPHEVYIEPFLGSGTIMARKRPAHKNIGLELNPITLELARAAVAEGAADSGVPSAEFDLRLEDGLAYLEKYKPTGQELIYCDPPYPHSTRTKKRLYGEHEWDDATHVRFLAAATAAAARGVRLIISSYYSDLYLRELNHFYSITFPAMTRGGVTREEYLWFNFPRPTELHDSRWVGDGWRERDWLKRMKKRWVAKLQKMDPRKRQALLEAIAETQRS
jgi:16S rRNA G966 N2-methylase RsmD